MLFTILGCIGIPITGAGFQAESFDSILIELDKIPSLGKVPLTPEGVC